MSTQKGTYIYHVDGEVAVKEPWEIDTDVDGARRITAARISTAYNVHMSLEAVETITFKTYAFTYRERADSEIIAQGWYRIENDKIFYRATESEKWQEEELGDRLFFPLMRVFTGDFICDVMAKGGEAEAIIPFIENPNQVSRLFTPTFSTRKVWTHETEPRAYRYLGGHYTSPVAVQTNEEGMMVHYSREPEEGPRWECMLKK